MRIKTLGNGYFFFPDFGIIVSREHGVVAEGVKNACLCYIDFTSDNPCAQFRLNSNQTRGILGDNIKKYEFWFFDAAEFAENKMFEDEAIGIVREGQTFIDNYQNGKELSYSMAYLLVRYRQMQNALADEYKKKFSLCGSLKDVKNQTQQGENELKRLEKLKNLDSNFIMNVLSTELMFKKTKALIENFILKQMYAISELKKKDTEKSNYYDCVLEQLSAAKTKAINNIFVCFSQEKRRRLFAEFKIQVGKIMQDATSGAKDSEKLIEEFNNKCERKFI